MLPFLTQCDVNLPFLLASSGLMSKISTPCIFPRISRRSRPVDCSRSVGMVPGLPPSGMRSCSPVISRVGILLAIGLWRLVLNRSSTVQCGIRCGRDRGEWECSVPSKGFTCLLGSPGLGSPWVLLSTVYIRQPTPSPQPSYPQSQSLPVNLSIPPFLLFQWHQSLFQSPSVRTGKSLYSHLLTLLTKLRAGTTGRAATARLATVETARRANI